MMGKKVRWVMVLLGLSFLNPMSSYCLGALEEAFPKDSEETGPPFLQFPTELTEGIYSYLDPKSLEMVGKVSARSREIALSEKVRRIDRLMEPKKYIPLPCNADSDIYHSISPVGITQALWFEIMGSNPS